MSRASRRREWDSIAGAWERLGEVDPRRIRNAIAIAAGGAAIVVAGLGIAGRL